MFQILSFFDLDSSNKCMTDRTAESLFSPEKMRSPRQWERESNLSFSFFIWWLKVFLPYEQSSAKQDLLPEDKELPLLEVY